MKEKIINKVKEITDKKRVSTKKRDRIPPSHDLAGIPSLVKNRIDYEPDLVVQPKEKEEIKELVKLSKKKEIPIVPRGSGTSAYGGSVPAAGGISISFARFRGVNDINEKEKTALIKPGTIWDDPASTDLTNIDKTINSYLNEFGLEVPAYPSSAPGSTIGGWVAEGGAGIGSFEFGEVRDIIKKIELITPNGTKELEGNELDFAVGAEGTTGIISEIELSIVEKKEKNSDLIAFDSSEEAVDFLNKVNEKKLSFWNVSLFNPNHTKKKQEATDENVLPSDKWLVLVTYPIDRDIESFEELINQFNGKRLDEELANYLWDERFFPLRYKRIGPSEIASESYVPIDDLSNYIDSLYEIDEEVILETKLIKGGEAYNLASITTDERAPSYMLSAMTQMQFDEAAKESNGSVYGVGMFNLGEAEDHFGSIFKELKRFKEDVDPNEIMNPGKIFRPKKRGKGVLNIERMMKLAKFFTPLKGITSFILSSKPSTKKDKELPEEIQYESFACSRCNYCTEVCDQWVGSKWGSQSPKGRWTFLRQYLQGNEEWDQEISDAFMLCTTCKRCNEVCQSNIPILEIWDEMRGPLIKDKEFATFRGFEMMKASADLDNNIWGFPKEERDHWIPSKEEKK